MSSPADKNFSVYKIKICPYCAKRQKVTQGEIDKHLKFKIGAFPEHYCPNCNRTSYVLADLSLRKLNSIELAVFKEDLIQGFKYFAEHSQKNGGCFIVFGSE